MKIVSRLKPLEEATEQGNEVECILRAGDDLWIFDDEDPLGRRRAVSLTRHHSGRGYTLYVEGYSLEVEPGSSFFNLRRD